jgi:hypothetical protein
MATYCDHGGCEESPRKELQENDDQGMVDTWLADTRWLQVDKTQNTYNSN